MAKKYEVREISQTDILVPIKKQLRSMLEYGNCLEMSINEILKEEFNSCPFHDCNLVDIKFSTSCHYLDSDSSNCDGKTVITKDALVIFSYDDLECSTEDCNYRPNEII